MATLDLSAGDTGASRDERLAQSTRILCVLFFFSVFPALIYQLTWQRALFRSFGVNVESVTFVVAAFVLGLGLGSLAGGSMSKRRIPLLPLLATVELVTAALGVASIAIFDRIDEFTAGWPLPAAASADFALVLAPTLLMATTLPVLVNHLVRRSGDVAGAVSLLYYVNTLGAGAACLAYAAVLFPLLGMRGAICIAVAINGVVALGALITHSRARHEFVPAGFPIVPASRRPPLAFVSVAALAAIGGFVSLSYVTFLVRTVSYTSGANATAFAATLSAFLVGLASGARQAGHHCATLSREEAMRRAVRGLMTANLLGLLFLPLLDHLAWLDRGIVGVAILITFLLARFWGALVPYLAEFGIAADERAGMRAALLYLCNIVGAALGLILAGLVLMDHLGLVGTGELVVIAGLLCALALVAALDLPRWHKVARTAMIGAFAIFAMLVMPHWSANLLESLQSKGSAHASLFMQGGEWRRVLGLD
jgi:spermidine synthase